MAENRMLMPHEVRAIRRFRRQGHAINLIAWSFGVVRQTVSRVVNGRSYTHVPDEVPNPPHPWDSLSIEDVIREKAAAKERAANERVRRGKVPVRRRL